MNHILWREYQRVQRTTRKMLNILINGRLYVIKLKKKNRKESRKTRENKSNETNEGKKKRMRDMVSAAVIIGSFDCSLLQ